MYDFNALMFLVKTGISANINFSKKLINYHFVFINNVVIRDQRAIVQPNSTFQIIVSYLLFNFYKAHVYRLFYFLLFFKKYMKFFYKKVFNRKNRQFRKRLKNLSFLKLKHLKFMESDYKSLTFILLPFKNNSVYYKYVYLV